MTEKLGKTLQLLLVLAVIVESHYFILREPIVEPHDFEIPSKSVQHEVTGE